MSLITIIIIFFCIFKLLDHMKLKAQQKQLERVKAEQKRSREWQRANEAWQRAKEREDARMAREVAKIAKEQTKQAEQIAKLEYLTAKANADIEYWTLLLADYNDSFENACRDAERYHAAGDNRREEQAKAKVISFRNKIHATEQRIAKAQFDIEQAERKMSA